MSENLTTERQKPINILNLLKFVAMLLIVWWHIGMPTKAVDWGARMCEFLFIASGFLVAYNYYHKGMEDSSQYAFGYLHKKIRKIWPLHIFMLIGIMLVGFKTEILGFNASKLPALFSNIFLVQAWSSDWNVIFSYNGVTWFLSALLFCYLLTPILIKCIKNKKFAAILFVFVALLRFAIEFAAAHGSNIFDLKIHSSPIVRLLEYFMGMLMVPFFLALREKMAKIQEKVWFKIIWTFVELGLVALIGFLMWKFNASWLRVYYVYVFCFFIFFIALDIGYVSKLCSYKPVRFIASIQFEIYIMQIFVSKGVNKFFELVNVSIPAWGLLSIKLVLLFALSILYKRFIEEPVAKLMDKIYNFFNHLVYGKQKT